MEIPLDFDSYFAPTPALTAKSSWSGTVDTSPWLPQIAEQAAFPPHTFTSDVRTDPMPAWSNHKVPLPLTVSSDVRSQREHSAASSDADLEESLLYTRGAFEYLATLALGEGAID